MVVNDQRNNDQGNECQDASENENYYRRRLMIQPVVVYACFSLVALIRLRLRHKQLVIRLGEIGIVLEEFHRPVLNC